MKELRVTRRDYWAAAGIAFFLAVLGTMKVVGI